MKLFTPVLLVVISLPLGSFAQSAFAGLGSRLNIDSIPAIRLVKPADVLAADVTIVATSRNASEQAMAFSSALGLFHAEVSRTPTVSIRLERTQQGGGAPSYLSSGKFDAARSFAELRVHVALQSGMDSTSAAQILRGLISRVKLPGDVEIKIESLRVEIREPDALRDELLQTIADDSVRLQAKFKTTPIRITGLEHSVMQRPLNDREVVAFIPYTLSLGGEN